MGEVHFERESDRQAAYLEMHDGSFVYGIEWGDPERDLPCVLSEWIGPRINPGCVAVEVGSGGGRWSRYFRDAKKTYLVDATAKSEEFIRGLCDCSRFEFLIAKDGYMPAIPGQSADYIFSFDTFVHFDKELFNTYLREFARILKAGGVLHLHYAQRLTENQSEDFRYCDPVELFALLKSLGFQSPTRRWFMPEGFGSVLVELVMGS